MNRSLVFSGILVAAGIAAMGAPAALAADNTLVVYSANDTDLNNFAPVFNYVQKENSTYYLIGYSPSNTKADGRFRRIRRFRRLLTLIR